MRFGVNTALWAHGFGAGDLGLVERAHALGADGIEFSTTAVGGLPVTDARRALDRHGIACTLCTSPPSPELSLVHPDADARARAVAGLRASVRVAAALGSPVVVGPLYAQVGWFVGRGRTTQEWDWAVEGFRQVTDDLDRHGVDLAIEPLNRWEGWFLATAADGRALCEAVGHPRVGLLLDTAHMVQEEHDLPAAVRTAGPWLRHVHVPESDRGAPGTGCVVDWPGLFAALRDVRYDRWCVIESFAWDPPGLAAATHTWRALAASPDALVRDGLAFLRAREDATRDAVPNPTRGTTDGVEPLTTAAS